MRTFVKEVWLRYSLGEGYKRVRHELMDRTKNIRKNKRKLNEDIREIEKKILEDASPEEILTLRRRREELIRGLKELQTQYDQVAKPYRARLEEYRRKIKFLDEIIVKDLQAFGLEVRPISLEEAESFLQALKEVKSEEVKSEEVKSENGGGTGEA